MKLSKHKALWRRRRAIALSSNGGAVNINIIELKQHANTRFTLSKTASKYYSSYIINIRLYLDIVRKWAAPSSLEYEMIPPGESWITTIIIVSGFCRRWRWMIAELPQLPPLSILCDARHGEAHAARCWRKSASAYKMSLRPAIRRAQISAIDNDVSRNKSISPKSMSR